MLCARDPDVRDERIGVGVCTNKGSHGGELRFPVCGIGMRINSFEDKESSFSHHKKVLFVEESCGLLESPEDGIKSFYLGAGQNQTCLINQV